MIRAIHGVPFSSQLFNKVRTGRIEVLYWWSRQSAYPPPWTGSSPLLGTGHQWPLGRQSRSGSKRGTGTHFDSNCRNPCRNRSSSVAERAPCSPQVHAETDFEKTLMRPGLHRASLRAIELACLASQPNLPTLWSSWLDSCHFVSSRALNSVLETNSKSEKAPRFPQFSDSVEPHLSLKFLQLTLAAIAVRPSWKQLDSVTQQSYCFLSHSLWWATLSQFWRSR